MDNDADLDFAIPGRATAVAAEALYLANLMLIPGLGFAALVVLWWQQRLKAPELARAHREAAGPTAGDHALIERHGGLRPGGGREAGAAGAAA